MMPVALDSVTLRRGLFPLSNELNFTSDKRTHILLFAVNAELMPLVLLEQGRG